MGDDTAGYEAKAKELAKSFVENFKKYTHMPADGGSRPQGRVKLELYGAPHFYEEVDP